MLKPIRTHAERGDGRSFAIVASRYNARYVDAMIKAARRELKRAGARVHVVRVPGAFEIPAVAAKLAGAESPGFAAIVCFGVVLQGETSHARHIGWGVTHALAQIQVQYQLPVVHGVFVFDTKDQARVRCLGQKHNRGAEAAQTALEMARVMAGLPLTQRF